ncbi:NADPH:quinone reductase [Pseudovibrio denitrificans]|uniref:NADPH:quinone reductase n=1 Tax=Pseudovibrio denitrificans TaxID=258256 RepID=A0A1I7A093_9HYPH|nr:alcohol dehydrogenase family protein [Pseudovibrio denitrificans]SFT68340.1 NADPH:quinone reductase [Pseudovibrio denitrificans]
MSQLPTTMTAVTLNGHGGPEMLELRTDLPLPKFGPEDVLVQVLAAGVNNTDINTRKAWYSKQESDAEDASWAGQPLHFPRIQGADVCGRVIAVGENVTQDLIGQRVLLEPCLQYAHGTKLEAPWYLGSECDGGFAEYVSVDHHHVYPIQSALSDQELASFPCSYSTAENMLTRANVQSGEQLLITGASGGVGSAAVQLAKARGANVVAVSSASKAPLLLELGADRVLDRKDDLTDSLGTNSIDVVIDLVAGEQWPSFMEVLKPKGRYTVAGAIGGPLVELDVRTLYLNDLSFFGCTMLEPQVFGNLVSHVEAGRIKPLVSQTFPLSQIKEAQEVFEQKKHLGKIVLQVAS